MLIDSSLPPGEIPGGRRIGIITGSGPEAGIDLWSKTLLANRRRLGPLYGGDVDAPHVVVVSVPRLGLSMDLERHHDVVWYELAAAARQRSTQVDCYAIACNTLNVFSDELEALGLPMRLVAFADCVIEYLDRIDAPHVAVLGARPIMELGRWSHYQKLHRRFDLPAANADIVERAHSLIERIKHDGAAAPRLQETFERLLDDIDADTMVLACTELPLVHVERPDKRLIDPTLLVAERLAELGATARSFQAAAG
jgi:aspartate racemase